MKQKMLKKNNTNHQKAAKTRRQRGYQWEDTIVKRFRKKKKEINAEKRKNAI
jgi:hypothetical protein